MNILHKFPAIVSLILLAAHFSRLEMNWIAIPVLLLPFLFFVRKRWVIPFLKGILYVGTFEWMRSVWMYVQTYENNHQSWTRLVIIMGSVAVFTLFSALILKPTKRA